MEIKPEGLDRPGEQAEQRLDPFDRQVAMTMAIIAAVLACVTMLSHRAHDDSLSLLAEANRLTTAANIHHTEASDQWGYYQAKNIRRHTDELFADLTTVVASKDAEAVAKLHEKYVAEADRYKDDQKELDTKARELQEEGELTRHKADRFDLSEVFLEIALVITSITLLSGRRIFWHLGLFMATAGVLVAASAWIVH